MTSPGTLKARVRDASRRVRVQRALEAAVVSAAWSIAALSAAYAVARTLELRDAGSLGWLAAALLALPVCAAGAAAARRVAHVPLLVGVDRSHGLPDLLSSAWAFAQLPAAAQTPFMHATLARAEAAARTVDLRRSQPFRRPGGLGLLALSLLGAALVWYGPHTPRPQPAPAAEATPTPRELARVDPAELAAFRRRLAQIDAQADRAPRADTLRLSLERVLDELETGTAERLQLLRRLRALEARARVLAASTAAERASAERTAAHWSDAPAADLRETLPFGRGPEPTGPAPQAEPPSPAPDPPARAGAQSGRSPDQPDPEGQRTGPNPGAPAGEPGAPGSSPAGQPQPTAAAPSRDPDDAPRDGEVERGDGAEQRRGTDLAQAIAELRDLIRRDRSLPGHPDDPASGGGEPPKRPRDSAPDRDDSRADRTGAPNAAYASSGPPPAAAAEALAAEPDRPGLPAVQTRVAGQPSSGPVRSQVIFGAAQRGFRGRDYARVHGDYERHAERELEREAVPPGYRGYVRRYFQAIAPRPLP